MPSSVSPKERKSRSRSRSKSPSRASASGSSRSRSGSWSRSRSPSPFEIPLLPIHKCKDELMELIKNNQLLVVTGDTGCGKSTQLSKFLDESGYSANGKIIAITQPRRIGAVSLAQRVADEIGVEVGEEVGYQVRFEDRCTSKTRIKYMTDGCLLRECLVHPDLQPYSVIVLDEAHERSLQTDILFGIVRRIVMRRKDLKLIVTSATLNVEKFCQYFMGCPSYAIPGRTFPVEVEFSEKTEKYYVEAAITKVLEIHTKEEMGHILVFLTGREQIENAAKLLGERVDRLYDDGIDMPDIVILPVYAAMPAGQQQQVFAPAPPDCRKVLLSTNICETSVTVDGIVYVIDPGYVKQRQFNPHTGIDALTTVPISRVAAVQRMGRAGRTRPGKCYRLYTEKVYQEVLKDVQVPEIQRTNLANTVLLLKSLGINNPLTFDFLDQPKDEAVVEALLQLRYLDAIDDNGVITELGKSMSQFPLEPSLSKLLLTATELQCEEEMLTITAMISAEDLWIRPTKKDEQPEADKRRMMFASGYGDHITLLFVYDSWMESGFSKELCRANFIDERVLRKAKEVRAQLSEILDAHKKRFKGEEAKDNNSRRKSTKNNDDARKNHRESGRGRHSDRSTRKRSRSRSERKFRKNISRDRRDRGKERSRSRDRNNRSRERRSKSRDRLRRQNRDRRSRDSESQASRNRKEITRTDQRNDGGSTDGVDWKHRERRKRTRSPNEDKHSGGSDTENSSKLGDEEQVTNGELQEDREQIKQRVKSQQLKDDLQLDTVTRCRKCIARAFFPTTARNMTPSSGPSSKKEQTPIYKNYSDSISALPHEQAGAGLFYIHPSSALCSVAPKWVVYTEVVFTSKAFIKGLCTIEFSWVEDLLPLLRTASIRRLVGKDDLAALEAVDKQEYEKTMRRALKEDSSEAEKSSEKHKKAEVEVKKTEGELQGAKERYLERKREQAKLRNDLVV